MSWLRTWQESAARKELAALGAKLRPEGFEVGPHLRAVIDQHAAAVRDILALTAGRAGPVQLAAYTRGIVDVAADRGWRPGTHFGAQDWVTLRLLAACDLALSDEAPRIHSLPSI
jgi:predicted heme/steroid binding protein